MSFESGAGGASSHGPAGSPVKIQGDLASVVRSQKRLLRGMQGNLDRGLAKVNGRIDQTQGQIRSKSGGNIWQGAKAKKGENSQGWDNAGKRKVTSDSAPSGSQDGGNGFQKKKKGI